MLELEADVQSCADCRHRCIVSDSDNDPLDVCLLYQEEIEPGIDPGENCPDFEEKSMTDVAATKPQQEFQVTWLPPAELMGHPNNMRPYSERYGMRVNEAFVAVLAEAMRQNGFDPGSPIKIRYKEGIPQIIGGHHRRCAAIEAEIPQVPCMVYSLSDMDSEFLVAQDNQSQAVEPWERVFHVARMQREWNINNREYARRTGISPSTVSEMLSAAKVATYLQQNTTSQNIIQIPPTVATDIATLPESDWEWFCALVVEKTWAGPQVKAALKGVKAVTTAFKDKEHHSAWLDLDIWKRRVALEAEQRGENRMQRDLSRWLEAAELCYRQLGNVPTVWKYGDDVPQPYQEIYPAREEFMTRLKTLSDGAKLPSSKKIHEVFDSIVSEIESINAAYLKWLEDNKPLQERRQAELEQAKQRSLIIKEYSPTGYCIDVRLLDLEEGSVDAIITDPPYRLSNGGITCRGGKQTKVDKNFDDSTDAIAPSEWVPLAFKWLKPGGCLVVTATPHVLFDIYNTGIAAGFEFRQKPVWRKRNPPPLLTADRFRHEIEDILVLAKPGGTMYFGYADVHEDGNQRGDCFEISEPSATERLGWHDCQKPLALGDLLVYAYVPPQGIMLDMFAGTATFPATAKRLGRKAVWVEINPEFFEKAQSRLEEIEFPDWLLDQG